MAMANTTPTIPLDSGANIKHGAQYHLVQMQRYLLRAVTGGNMKLGSSGNGVTRSGERSGSMEIGLLAVEGENSAVKRTFGENLASRLENSMCAEAIQKFVFYDFLKDYGKSGI